jgi:hypothetical protein
MSSVNPNVSSISLIDNLHAQAVEYAKAYHLPDTFIYYCLGAAWNTVGMSSSMISDFLDYSRKEFDGLRERLEADGEGS